LINFVDTRKFVEKNLSDKTSTRRMKRGGETAGEAGSRDKEPSPLHKRARHDEESSVGAAFEVAVDVGEDGRHGLDTALCADMLAAVCEWVESMADLVRLSCASHALRQVVARDALWRRHFRLERGKAAHDALALAIRLHGAAALNYLFALDRLPPDAQHLPKKSDSGESGLGVWFEALVATGAHSSL
jgi:hypothetical protein